VSLVTTRIEGVLHECTSYEDAEAAIVEMCKKWFLLTDCTWLTNDRKLSQDPSHLGGSTAATDILGGTYEFLAETDFITTELFKCIHDLSYKYSTPSMSTKIRIQEYNKFWVTCRKKTSSSYSGLRFGHYKASANNDFLAIIHAKYIEMCFQNGVPLCR